MGLLYKLGEIVDEAKKEYGKIENKEFETVLKSGSGESILALGNNLNLVKYLQENGYNKSLQMIYLDPPFFSKAKYQASFTLKSIDNKSHKIKMFAYDDRWNYDVESYIKEMTVSLLAMKELLKDDGVIAVHLDWHAVHYARLVMDEIFGADHFINEIIWHYKSGGSGKKGFAKKHDNILIYKKGESYKFNMQKEKSYNRELKPYRFKNIEEYQDNIGWYTMVSARDVWQIDMVGRTSSERTGYATQKPQALLERLINAFSDEGDMVADFFTGSGTTLGAALNLKRKWICCDLNPMSISLNLEKTVGKDANFAFIKEKDISLNMGKLQVKVDEGITLDRYAPEICKADFPADSYEVVSEIARKEPTRLINFVSFDFNHNGQYHQSCHSLRRQKDIIDDTIDYCQKSGKKVHIMAVDIFGKFSETEIVE